LCTRFFCVGLLLYTGMKPPISVTIICKNAAATLPEVLQSVEPLCSEMVVVDSGSTDGSLQIAEDFGCKVLSINWQGFGHSRITATHAASHDWILSIDADEMPDKQLQQAIQNLSLNNKKMVYSLRRKNYLGDRPLLYGEWGRDKHIRLFNKTHVNWMNVPVHEALHIPADTAVKTLPGYVHHYTAASAAAFAQKSVAYAQLNAQKYFNQGKKAGLLKPWISAAFYFIQNFFFRLGFLDGKPGWQIACINTQYTFLKYHYLRKLWQNA
jgi:glycosyltransferase involved in cell wall biosynthesis